MRYLRMFFIELWHRTGDRWYAWTVFLLGMQEFRSDVTSHQSGEWVEVYDMGRALARGTMRMP